MKNNYAPITSQGIVYIPKEILDSTTLQGKRLLYFSKGPVILMTDYTVDVTKLKQLVEELLFPEIDFVSEQRELSKKYNKLEL